MDFGLREAGGVQANPHTDPEPNGEDCRDTIEVSVDSSQENLLS